MTALANAIKRKTHKERSQPAARRKYGLLEKHKDYVQRAKDFHKKEKIIKTLKRKAEERNPDEFYFSMEKSRTKDGVHDGRLTQANKYSQEQLALMKTQDTKYLGMKARAEEQKARRLRESLHFIGVPGARAGAQHTVFVGSEAEARTFDAAAYFGTPAELLDRTFNRPRAEQLAAPAAAVGREAARKIEKRKNAAYKELAQRTDRRAKLAGVAQALEAQKAVAGRGRKRKLAPRELAPDTPAEAAGKVFRWKRERKK